MGDRDVKLDNIRTAIIETIEGIIGSARLKVSQFGSRRGSKISVSSDTEENGNMVQGPGILKASNVLRPGDDRTVKDARKRSVTFDPKFLKEEIEREVDSKQSETTENGVTDTNDRMEITRL